MIMPNDKEPQVLTSDEFRTALAERCKLTTRSLLIASAFITAPAMAWILRQLPTECEACFIARWTRSDLANGASDFESYYLAKSRGHRFFVDPTLHTKAYLFDDESVFIGSANLTSRGLSLDGCGNQEHVTLFRPSIRDVNKLNTILRQATELSDIIVQQMEDATEEQDRGLDDWPIAISSALERKIRGLWVADLPLAPPPKRERNVQLVIESPEYNFLNYDCTRHDTSTMKDLFLASKAWAWLRGQLDEHEDLRFGRATVLLHDSLLDDPAPYRSDVKKLVENLFLWVEFSHPPLVTVVQHKHTRSLRTTLVDG